MNIDLNKVSTINSRFSYPNAGLPTFTSSSTASVPVLQASTSNGNLPTSSTYSYIRSYFPKVNSFSIAKMCDNSAIIAVSSQDQNLLSLPNTTDQDELARREASRVYLLTSAIDDKYASTIRTATVVSSVSVGLSSTSSESCAPDSFLIQLDSEVSLDSKISSVWPISGPFENVKLTISQRYENGIVSVQPDMAVSAVVGDCFKCIAYGGNSYSSPISLAMISPLPYIETSDGVVSASNPQVASYDNLSPSSNKYVYVIAEATVDGTYQLFFYSARLGKAYSDSDVYGWKQLTFDGENRNAKLKVDNIGNLHITWESSRCQPGQVYYGVLGPSSRFINNAAFMSVIEKQIESGLIQTEGNWDNEVDATGNVSWISNAQLLPAGNYKVTYKSGANNDGSGWTAAISIVNENSTIETISSLSYSTLAECESANEGSFVEFHHSGGPLGIKFLDTTYGDNAEDTQQPLTYNIKVISIDDQSFGLSFNLLKTKALQELDLRELDEYGVPQGDALFSFTANGGTSTITDENNFTVSGNPSKQKFSVFGFLNRDENDNYFNNNFAQLSYQVNFDLTLNCPESSNFRASDISDEFILFKQQFSPQSGSENENLYYKDGKTYSIDQQKSFETTIPIHGAFKNVSIPCGLTVDDISAMTLDELIAQPINNAITCDFDALHKYQFELNHYMLVAMPEKIRFVAKSTDGSSDIIEEYLTGYFKLGLVLKTSSDLSNRSASEQNGHWIRQFGSLYKFGEKNSYKLAIHYSHQRNESEYFISDKLTNAGDISNTRYNGDIIVLVNEDTVLAESFMADFSATYNQFDLGFGCLTVGEFRSLLLNPYDTSLNEDTDVEMVYENVIISPHSIIANDYSTDFSLTDRNVSSMFIDSIAGNSESINAADEDFLSDNDYWLTLGLVRDKVSLTQIPITISGLNNNPSIDVDNCGRPHISFQSIRDGNWEIYYTGGFNSGMPFRFDTKLSNTSGNAFNPSISVDNKGRRLVAWHDSRDGSYQIYAARSNETFDCEKDTCKRDYVNSFGNSDIEYYDEYDPYLLDNDRFGRYCTIKFEFTNNSGSTKKFHFRINFYLDQYLTSFGGEADSRLDISNWSVDNVQMPFDGYEIENGQTVEVVYVTTKDNNLNESIYYCEIESDDGDSVLPLNKIMIYGCGDSSHSKCVIPIVYTNITLSSETVKFRVTFYRDEAMTEAVLSAYTLSDVKKWVTGDSVATAGIIVNSGETISVTYNPEILPQALVNTRNQINVQSLVCGARYWVRTESIVGSTASTIDEFAFDCPCDGIRTGIWREPTENNDWTCTGLGGFDAKLTNTSYHAFFPKVAASADGFVYITWEDRRFGKLNNKQSIYYGIWDSVNDKFYCSNQGFVEGEISSPNYSLPAVVVNNTLHPSFAFTDGKSIFVKTISLSSGYELSSSSSSRGEQGLNPSSVIDITDADVSCMSIKVYAEDVKELYHYDYDKPIELVDDCLIRLEVKSIQNAIAVRFKNENNNWSSWISVGSPIPTSSSSSSAINFESTISGYNISSDRFVVPWILSAGNGTKTVHCQVMTQSGITPEFSKNIIARYSELKYKINFFKDAEMTIAASKYNQVPVLGLNQITIDQENVTSLLSSTSSTNSVYFKVEFDDKDRVEKILELLTTSNFYEIPAPVFDIYTQGFNKFNQKMSSSTNGIYFGSFDIGEHNGVDYLDGLAYLQIKMPSPCSTVNSSSSNCSAVITGEQIKERLISEFNDAKIDMSVFRQKYTPDIMCTFTSKACIDGEKPEVTEPVDDYTEPADDAISCQEINWTSPRLGEVNFYKNGTGPNSTTWAVISQEFELDLSDSRVDYVAFNTALTKIDDVLLMIKSNETVVSVPTTGLVEFKLPQGTIIFGATDGYYCHGSNVCNNGSIQKKFTIGSTIIGTIPAGTSINNGTGTVGSIFTTIPDAQGILYTPSSSSSMSATMALKTNISRSVSKQELFDRGYVSENGILKFKLVHIISGVGYADIYGLTCGASCFSSSSSS